MLENLYPVIIKNGKIELGTVHNNELLYMDTPEIMTLVENLLSYALIRDEYREICKRKREFDKEEKWLSKPGESCHSLLFDIEFIYLYNLITKLNIVIVQEDEMRMDMLAREILNQSIAEAIDATRNKICAEDEVYQQDEKDLDELTKRFMELDLPEHDRMIINDYIACLQTVDCRYADISYMAGIEDAITFLKKMDLIKNTIE